MASLLLTAKRCILCWTGTSQCLHLRKCRWIGQVLKIASQVEQRGLTKDCQCTPWLLVNEDNCFQNSCLCVTFPRSSNCSLCSLKCSPLMRTSLHCQHLFIYTCVHAYDNLHFRFFNACIIVIVSWVYHSYLSERLKTSLLLSQLAAIIYFILTVLSYPPPSRASSEVTTWCTQYPYDVRKFCKLYLCKLYLYLKSQWKKSGKVLRNFRWHVDSTMWCGGVVVWFYHTHISRWVPWYMDWYWYMSLVASLSRSKVIERSQQSNHWTLLVLDITSTKLVIVTHLVPWVWTCLRQAECFPIVKFQGDVDTYVKCVLLLWTWYDS